MGFRIRGGIDIDDDYLYTDGEYPRGRKYESTGVSGNMRDWVV